MRRYIGQILFFILLIFCALSYPQSVNTKNLLDTYKDIYLWQEPRNNIPVSDSVLTVLGRWAWGPNLAVDADSNFAYIGNGPTFHVLDISDPSSPKIVGEYLTEGHIYDIELKNNLAFASIGSGLLILDITNPLQPEKISEVEIGGVAISFALDDSFVYVTTFSGVMWVVDISNINNPYKRGVTPAGGQLAFSVEAKDRYVYIGNPEYPPMVIVDANNPDTLSRVDFEVGGWGLSAFLKDTLLFVGVRGYYGGRYLKIYDVSNAAFPEFISDVEIQTFVEINGITVSEDDLTAYVLTHNQGIYSIDLTDLTQPVVLDKFERTLPIDVGNAGIAISKNTLLASYYSGLLSLNVSEPDSLKQRSFFPTCGTALEMDSKEDLVFAACGLSGLWILDFSNPQKIENIANVITGGSSVNIIVDENYAYVVNWNLYSSENDSLRGLWIIDISNPYQPNILTHYIGSTSLSPPHAITKSGNFLFITQTSGSGSDTILEIIDVNDILNPKQVSILTGNYHPHNIVVKDSTLFLATSDRGLRIVNISDIYNPNEVGVFNDSTFLVGIQIKNNLAFADRIDTLFVLDISNPINPSVLGKMGRNYGGFSTIDLEINQNYLYWANGSLGVIDISDSTAPKELALFNNAYLGYDVETSGDVILFSELSEGIWFLKNDLITSVDEPHLNSLKDFELLQNYPNPFNPTTTIEFNIVQREKVLIEIFDLLGQRVKVLLNEEMEIGRHKINFNAVGLSSGIYFYRIRTKETTVTKKMVLLR